MSPAKKKSGGAFARYAVYYSPPPSSPLHAFSRQWLGRDTFTGETVKQAQVDGVSAKQLTAITAAAARYGFHATLKAPFRLKAGATYGDLKSAVSEVAREAQAVFQAASGKQGKAGYLPDVTPDFIEGLERELAGSVGAL